MRALGPKNDTVVQIFDQRTSGDSEAVEVNERRRGNERVVEVTIRDNVRGGIRSGVFDAAMRNRFGIVPNTPGR
jgi:hypothetical protein